MSDEPRSETSQDDFRLLMERKISVDEYVRRLDQRTAEARELDPLARSADTGSEGEG